MATLASIANGNASSSTTWGLCDPTSESDSEASNALTTTAYQTSSTFTPGAITIDGIFVKLNAIPNPTGTITVALDLATVDVSGTVVTLNVADLPQVGVTTGATHTWIFFKFAAPVLVVAATVYGVKVKTSTTNTVRLDVSATTNWSRELRTTTTQSFAAGDKLLMCGEYTGAGTGNNLTVTWDNTATTSIGSTAFPESVVIGGRGICTTATSASTAYKYNHKGIFYVGAGGTWNIGTSGTRMPSTSSAVMTADSAANVDSGWKFDNLATVNAYGVQKQRWTSMTADKAAAATVIALAATTGWANGDVLCFASSDRTNTHAEAKTVSTVDSSTQVTLSAGLTNAHTGTATGTYGIQCEVGNLTGNVKFAAASTSLQGYIVILGAATVVLDNAEILNMGSATPNKRGIEVQTTTGSCTLNSCAIHDFIVANSIGCFVSGSTSNNFTITNNVIYNAASVSISTASTSGTTYTIDSNAAILTVSSNAFNLQDSGGTITNNVAASSANYGFILQDSNVWGTVSGNTAHSNVSVGFELISQRAAISSAKAYYNGGVGLNFETCKGIITVTNPIAFGNTTANIGDNITIFGTGFSGEVQITGGIFDSSASFATLYGLNLSGGTSLITLESCTFGASSVHTTASINVFQINNFVRAILRNCAIAESTFISNQINLDQDSYILVEKYNQTAGNHRNYQLYGNGTVDTTIFNIASPSYRITPSNASNKVQSAPPRLGFRAAVANGQTLTATAQVRESVVGDGTAYNGNAPRLFVRRNVALGITADTLLGTYSGAAGTFRSVSGTTATVNDDGVLEFYIDCDGTTGWINIDDFVVS